jgi:hypothetical protein
MNTANLPLPLWQNERRRNDLSFGRGLAPLVIAVIVVATAAESADRDHDGDSFDDWMAIATKGAGSLASFVQAWCFSVNGFGAVERVQRLFLAVVAEGLCAFANKDPSPGLARGDILFEADESLLARWRGRTAQQLVGGFGAAARE